MDGHTEEKEEDLQDSWVTSKAGSRKAAGLQEKSGGTQRNVLHLWWASLRCELPSVIFSRRTLGKTLGANPSAIVRGQS